MEKTMLLIIAVGGSFIIGFHVRGKMDEPLKEKSKNHYYWMGKSNYYLGAVDVFYEKGLVAPSDTIWQEVEKRYQINSKIDHFLPYPSAEGF